MIDSATLAAEIFAGTGEAPMPPRWARGWAGAGASLATAIIPRARAARGLQFQQLVFDAYRRIRRDVDASMHRHIVRMWNHILGIHDPMVGDCDRYMLFNAGRFAAMREWFGATDEIHRSVPAASGIGHAGDELVIHALSVEEPGAAIENIHQIPAYRYSRRYGRVPPCFSRAMRVAAPRRALLIAGTAAITGESSQFNGDLSLQFALTLSNLVALLESTSMGNNGCELAQLRDVRIYLPAATDADAAAHLARAAFDESAALEFISAELCRADLLVEIEGIALLDSGETP